jgi:hypothetical protein
MRAITTDETGHVYTRLTVLYRVGSDSRGGALWACACACGGAAVVRGDHLRLGKTKSCGCYRVDLSRSYAREVAA